MEERTSLKMGFKEYSKRSMICQYFGNEGSVCEYERTFGTGRYIVEIAKQAMAELGIKPLIVPRPVVLMGQDCHLWDCPHRICPMGRITGMDVMVYPRVFYGEDLVNVIVKISELMLKYK